MPLNFPNQWGVKKDWASPNQTPLRSSKQSPMQYKRYNKETRKMKCPMCGEWVDYFNYHTPCTEYGTVNEDGEFDQDDTDYGDTTIECPRCNREVFNSDWQKLVDYYSEERGNE